MLDEEEAMKLAYILETLSKREHGDVAISMFFLQYNSTGSQSLKKGCIEEFYKKLKGQENDSN